MNKENDLKESDLISITEYAKIHGRDRDTVKQKCQRGGFETARKIGRNWVIDKNEPYIDNRIIDGTYKNWRNKSN